MMYNIPVFEMQEAVRDLAIEIAVEQGVPMDDAETQAQEILDKLDGAENVHQAMYCYLADNGANPALHSKEIVLEITPAEGVELADLSDKDAQLMYLAASISFKEAILDEDFSKAAKAVANRFLDLMDFDTEGNIAVSLTIDSEQVEYAYGDETCGDFEQNGLCEVIQRRAAVLSVQDAVNYLHKSGSADLDTISTLDANELAELFEGFQTVEYQEELRRFIVIANPGQNLDD